MLNKERQKVKCKLFRILTVASLCSSIINLTLLSICLSAGRWIFGDLLCQIFAFISHALVAGAVWLVALVSLERYFKLVLPDDHHSVFSDINTKLLVVGLYLLVAFILINPLYGWGEYSEYRGFFQLTVHFTQLHTTELITTHQGPSTNISDDPYQGCDVVNKTQYTIPGEFNIPHLADLFTTNFKVHWNIYSRILVTTEEILTFSLRAPNIQNLNSFLKMNDEGTLGNQMLKTPPNHKNISSFICIEFVLNTTEVKDYGNIFVPFQATNMCTVDFTTINKGAWGWLIFFIISTGIGPYMVIACCSILTCRRWKVIKWENHVRDLVQYRRYYYGCIGSFLFYFPYFIINISNYFGGYVSPTVNIIVVFMYFSSNLLPCALLGPENICKSIVKTPSSEIEMEVLHDSQASIVTELV